MADPRRCPRMDIWLHGQRQPDLCCPAQEGTLTELPLLPRQIDAATVALYIQAVSAGEKPAPGPLERQVELLMRALGASPRPLLATGLIRPAAMSIGRQSRPT